MEQETEVDRQLSELKAKKGLEAPDSSKALGSGSGSGSGSTEPNSP
jgi:hypothetical protein